MASVMAIGSEVSGDCCEGIKVEIFWVGKMAPNWQRTGEMVPGIYSPTLSALRWFKKKGP